ncbi:peptide-N4-(N-acetyl-beta-glucosaminyl)asparagine amidase A-like [Triticum dicoccoides]|uniref:Peptide N-acetyl-beta-D-glucosaminyl asparaginase amidase A N-terminal domain-containing protein n=2 Tax=Triticum TaxID=4564 RepID=A0A9R0XWV1_TRITD|nr:peptide-N4-(N-acetyl-beta-glucosaminyl)asparagine amidase A-like [Triticum dicoccoides]XP_044406228.1 peptide-N4-(N-acetyl-beta-glucosaminyl)asparagine amidase A-like [Triticum aestivum]VAI43970.1 unnamed protein product [Triticum turgidum subsp. durum]
MAASCIHLVFLLCLVPAATVASPRRNLRKSPVDIAAVAPSPAGASRPTTFFEVARPLRPPPGSSGPCSTLLLSGSFAYTFTKPPATAAYSPPPCLGRGGASAVSLAVLEWRATCRGVQFDRIFGVWLGGAELLRGSTAEPLQNGVVWSVSKDVTRHASLLAAGNSTLAVFVENLVNSQYTGVYYANVTLHLYFRRTPTRPPPAVAPADLIVPMSRGLPLNDGLWYKIQNATDVASKSVALPSNTYRAVLELYVSFHGDDEFWWTNQPGADANGPFREVTVRVDGVLAGAAWPFPVIFTGGINPLLWQPITGIGSFNLPTYDVEVTPLLGKMLDGKAHAFAFAVTNAVDVWYVDANLHLWLDPGSTATAAALVSYVAPELAAATTSFRTTASRQVSATGWVKSSYGNITTNATQTFHFDNTNTNTNDGETVNQTTVAHAGVAATDLAGVLYYSVQTRRRFPLLLDSGADQVTVTHGLEETTVAAGRWSSGPRYQSLRNTRRSSVAGASRGVRQTYRYEATDGCYLRNVTSSGYNIVSDQSSEACVKGSLR